MPKRFEVLYNHPLYMLGRQINNITCKKNTFISNTSPMFDLK